MAKMDQLTQDCIAARKAGMSYGKYMATMYTPPVIHPVVEVEPELAEPKETAIKRVCKNCGKEIPRNARSDRRHCDDECRYEWNKKLALARYHKNKMKDNDGNEYRVCSACGKEIPTYMHGSSRYCSEECRYERQLEMDRARYQKNKDQINAKRSAKRNGKI